MTRPEHMPPVDPRTPRDLLLLVVYNSPADAPGMFVAREFVVRAGVSVPIPGELCIAAETLPELRAQVPPSLLRIPRSVTDDPCIVETYL